MRRIASLLLAAAVLTGCCSHSCPAPVPENSRGIATHDHRVLIDVLRLVPDDGDLPAGWGPDTATVYGLCQSLLRRSDELVHIVDNPVALREALEAVVSAVDGAGGQVFGTPITGHGSIWTHAVVKYLKPALGLPKV